MSASGLVLSIITRIVSSQIQEQPVVPVDKIAGSDVFLLNALQDFTEDNLHYVAREACRGLGYSWTVVYDPQARQFVRQ